MLRWKRKRCGCVNAVLASVGPVTIRCATHLGKRTKKRRALAHWEDVGGTLMVRHD